MNEAFKEWVLSNFENSVFQGSSVLLEDKLRVHFLLPCQQSQYDKDLGKKEIVLWEDIWQSHTEQVKSRILSLLGNNKRISARNTQIITLDKSTLDAFLDKNHLMGSSAAKYKMGLFYKGILVAAASFSAPKTYYRERVPFRSVVLIRFASLSGLNVVGGLSKILDYFIEKHHPDDIMTYADREWSDGEMYEKLDFAFVETTPPQQFWVHKTVHLRYNAQRLPETLLSAQLQSGIPLGKYLQDQGYCLVHNLGNRKYLLKLK